ncbi:MAG: hypothetical protein IT258_00080 [Saprospiraceae bacterium]|nr:hypothetical protein [Saprospiraceae bacterium]
MVIVKFLVTRHYKEKTDGDLIKFEQAVLLATDSVAAYDAVKDQVAAVKTAAAEFETAVANAAGGGTSLTDTKNQKRDLLLAKLDLLGTALQLTVKEDVTYITNAHYQVRIQGERSSEPLPDPELDFVNAGVLSGTTVGKVKDFPKGVKSIAVEYSEDDGLTWKNGTYTTGKKFTVSGMAPRKEYLVRVLYHGTFQRTSNPSKPLPVFVL